MDSLNSPRSRRYHSEEFKLKVIAACQPPGASVAQVALNHGVNANQVRRWMRERGVRITPSKPPSVSPQLPGLEGHSGFIPLPAPYPETPATIRLEIQRGTTRMSIDWPVSSATSCAAWLTEWLA